VVANGDSLLDVAARRRAGVPSRPWRRRHRWWFAPIRRRRATGSSSSSSTDRLRRIVGLPETPIDVPLRPFMFPGLHVFEPEVFAWMDAGGPSV
jgi:hypothetical protein